MRTGGLENYYLDPMDVKYPWWGKYLDNFTRNYSREEVASQFNLSGESCLDIACGHGHLLNLLLKDKYKRMVGVDVAPDLIKKAKKEAPKNAFFVLEDVNEYVESLLKKKTMFDDVYMIAILEHIFWPKVFVSKISRLIRKGGHAIVEVPNVAWLPHRISLLKGDFPETAPTHKVIPGVHDEHIRFYTLKTLDLMFREFGLKRINVSCSGRLRELKMIYPRLLAPDLAAVYQKR